MIWIRPFCAATLVAAALGCARPLQSIELSPMGHGAWSRLPGPRAIAWRANALSAPCALHCRAGQARDISCACTSVDSIYFSHLDDGMRLGAAEPAPKARPPSPWWPEAGQTSDEAEGLPQRP